MNNNKTKKAKASRPVYLPSELCDDHLCAELIELRPEIFVLQTGFDAGVGLSSWQPWSGESALSVGLEVIPWEAMGQVCLARDTACRNKGEEL